MADPGDPGSGGPKASRPQMPGYGVPASLEGVLLWEWARERLSKSHNYWLTTVRPNGMPHTMVVWGIWLGGAYYFSTGATTRKASNLRRIQTALSATRTRKKLSSLKGLHASWTTTRFRSRRS